MSHELNWRMVDVKRNGPGRTVVSSALVEQGGTYHRLWCEEELELREGAEPRLVNAAYWHGEHQHRYTSEAALIASLLQPIEAPGA